jgi:myo-inositol catabolism protein IolC
MGILIKKRFGIPSLQQVKKASVIIGQSVEIDEGYTVR